MTECMNPKHSEMCKGKENLPGYKMHHIILRSQGGSDDPDNLICLCPRCHNYAHGLGNLKVDGHRVTGRQFIIGVLEGNPKYKKVLTLLKET